MFANMSSGISKLNDVAKEFILLSYKKCLGTLITACYIFFTFQILPGSAIRSHNK